MKIREILTYVLVGAMAFLLIQQRCTMRELRNQIGDIDIPEPYQLPDDVVTMTQLEGHIMKVVSRIEGDTSYIVEEHYIPDESSVKYIVRVDTLAMEQLEQAQSALWQLQQQVQSPEDSIRVDSLQTEIDRIRMMLTVTDVEYDTHGFCLVPELGIGLDSHFDPNIEVGARVYYFNRFGAGFHGAITLPVDTEQTRDASLGIFLDYRLPGWDNAAFFASGDLELTSGQGKLVGGLQVYLK